MSIWCLPTPCLALVLGTLLLWPSGALACSLDGVASLSVDGRRASPNDGPTGVGLPVWAPFTLDASTPGVLLHFAEDLSKVRRSLSAEAFASPFRWGFGDGVTATGRAATHRYARTGWYTITVSYYWPSQHRWVEFDRAKETILPASALWHPRSRPAGMGPRLAPLGLSAALAAGALLWARTRLRRPGRLPAPRQRHQH